MIQYSSRDFGKTKNSIESCLPDRLVHKNVEGTARDNDFSKDRKHPVYVVDLPSRTLSVTVGHLGPKKATRRHRHTYETILFILEGEGTTHINERKIDWEPGDAVYIPPWAWHHHLNRSHTRARYLACENAPLLQNLAGVALREEA